MTGGKRIFGAFTVAIALFFFWTAVIGQWQLVSALRAAVAERTDLLSQRQKILDTIAAAYQEYQSKLSASDGTKFGELVPVSKDTAGLVSAMQGMASQAGAQLTEVGIADAKGITGQQYKALALSMKLAGSYGALRQFLAAVESYVRVLTVTSIQASSDIRNPGQVTFTILANAYFLK